MRRGEITLRHLLEPIQHRLDDEQMVEIVTQKTCEVGCERAGKWEWDQVPEFTYKQLDAIGLVAGNLMSKDFDPGHPICLTHLPSGERLSMARSPATDQDVIVASIRVPSRDDPKDETYDDSFDALLAEAENRLDRGPSGVDLQLIELHRAKEWRQFFTLAIKARKTFGATGKMRSGKTTLIRRRLMPQIDPEDRVVTIEDTPEFGPLPLLRNRVALYFGAAGITAEDNFEFALRTRADRVAFQELRGKEVMAFIRLQASGHTGSLTTWHADEDDPFTPLVLMAKTSPAGQNYPEDKLERMLRGFIDIVVHCQYDSVSNRFSIPSVYFRGAE